MRKATVTVPDSVFDEAKELSGNFSSLVTEALEEYIRKKKIDRAAQSFGKWTGRKGKSTDIVEKIRTDKGRPYADRAD